MNNCFTYLILCWVFFFTAEQLFHAFVLTYILKINLLLLLGINVINVKTEHSENLTPKCKCCNVNLFKKSFSNFFSNL